MDEESKLSWLPKLAFVHVISRVESELIRLSK